MPSRSGTVIPIAARSLSSTSGLGLEPPHQRPDRALEAVAGAVLGLPRGLGGGVSRIVSGPGRGGGVEVYHVDRVEPQFGQGGVDVGDEVGLPGLKLGVASGDVIGHRGDSFV